ncbi:urease accessory protein UreD [Micromonospora sp. M12]
MDPARVGPPRRPAPAGRAGRPGLMRALARLVARADGRAARPWSSCTAKHHFCCARPRPTVVSPRCTSSAGRPAHSPGTICGWRSRWARSGGPGAQRRRVHRPTGPAGAVSRMAVRAVVHAGATLHWLPEQLVAATGCAHLAESKIELAAGASLRWRDELICGRYGEAPGGAVVHTRSTTRVGHCCASPWRWDRRRRAGPARRCSAVPRHRVTAGGRPGATRRTSHRRWQRRSAAAGRWAGHCGPPPPRRAHPARPPHGLTGRVRHRGCSSGCWSSGRCS